MTADPRSVSAYRTHAPNVTASGSAAAPARHLGRVPDLAFVEVAVNADDHYGMAPSRRWTTVTIDCQDAEALADFYCRLLGWETTARDGRGWVQARDPNGGVGLNFQSDAAYRRPTWPEIPQEQAKMLHFEILVDDLGAAVAHTVAAGGSVAPQQPPDRDPSRLRVMLDPAGHPFCLYVSGE
jgi:catechol 2,3-dioxygenase-like lactoylglutathione lyase family enzyme